MYQPFIPIERIEPFEQTQLHKPQKLQKPHKLQKINQRSILNHFPLTLIFVENSNIGRRKSTF